MKYVDVILPLPLEGMFTYTVPPTLEGKVAAGSRVLVTLGKNKQYVGICHSDPKEKEADSSTEANTLQEKHDKATEKKEKEIVYKPILKVLDQAPYVKEHQLRLWEWIASYYLSSIGDVFKAAMPSGLKGEEAYKPKTETYVVLHQALNTIEHINKAIHLLARSPKQAQLLNAYLDLSNIKCRLISNHEEQESQTIKPLPVSKAVLLNEAHAGTPLLNKLIDRGILNTYDVEVGRISNVFEENYEAIKPLNQYQQTAYYAILTSMQQHNVTLLHGVTASGKTEIYIKLIQKTIAEGKQVLYLLPEIALTVQITERLRRVFGNRLGVYHSRYSDAERVEIWQKQLTSQPYDIILGARSAVFLPFDRLGLVVIDEEHESSFKQYDPAPRYHARSVAIMLASMFQAKTLLGTATPSIESYYNSQQNKYGLVELKHRHKDVELPEIEIVDVKDLQRRKMMKGAFSPQLLSAIYEALQRKEQVILFQNRRGFSPMLECSACGWVPKCPNCDVSLTLHKNMNYLNCHYCGHTIKIPQACPCCEHTVLRNCGFGTERIEEEIINIYPDVKIARMDLDTTRSKTAYEKIIGDFSKGKTNVLIGTQMVSKGLDFDKVSVVGILNADTLLNYPDFRAYENAFAMLGQVSGRAGRKGNQGRVILQTKQPTLDVLQLVKSNNYQAFYSMQLDERRAFHYPPYYRIIYVYLKHKNENTLNTAALEMAARLKGVFDNRVLGPDKPGIARVKTLHIRKIILKLENGIDLRQVKLYLIHHQNDLMTHKRYGNLMIYYDVDPQ